MLNYDHYSKKSIQESNGNVKDCLIYIPNYSNYLSSLLGYNFDKVRKEWVITDGNSVKKQLKFAGLCILSAHAHQNLTTMKNESQFQDDNDDRVSTTLEDNFTELDDKWSCEICTFMNSNSDVNCLTCLVSRPKATATIADMEPAAKKSKPNHWQCETCTFLTSDDETNCECCGQSRSGKRQSNTSQIRNGRRKLSSESNGDTSSIDSKHFVLPTKSIKSLPTALPNSQFSQPESFVESSSSPGNNALIKINGEWSCEKCTFSNSASDYFCKVCLESRKSQLHVVSVAKSEESEHRVYPTSMPEKQEHHMPKHRVPSAPKSENHEIDTGLRGHRVPPPPKSEKRKYGDFPNPKIEKRPNPVSIEPESEKLQSRGFHQPTIDMRKHPVPLEPKSEKHDLPEKRSDKQEHIDYSKPKIGVYEQGDHLKSKWEKSEPKDCPDPRSENPKHRMSLPLKSKKDRHAPPEPNSEMKKTQLETPGQNAYSQPMSEPNSLPTRRPGKTSSPQLKYKKGSIKGSPKFYGNCPTGENEMNRGNYAVLSPGPSESHAICYKCNTNTIKSSRKDSKKNKCKDCKKKSSVWYKIRNFFR